MLLLFGKPEKFFLVCRDLGVSEVIIMRRSCAVPWSQILVAPHRNFKFGFCDIWVESVGPVYAEQAPPVGEFIQYFFMSSFDVLGSLLAEKNLCYVFLVDEHESVDYKACLDGQLLLPLNIAGNGAYDILEFASEFGARFFTPAQKGADTATCRSSFAFFVKLLDVPYAFCLLSRGAIKTFVGVDRT